MFGGNTLTKMNSCFNWKRKNSNIESFSFEIQTSGSDDTFTLPLITGGTFDFSVDWGDGNSDTITSYNQAEATHTYSTEGTYTIKMRGTCTKFAFNNTGDKTMITKLLSCYDMGFDDLDFYGCSNLTEVCSLGSLTSLTNLYNTFRGTGITSIPTGIFDGLVNLAANAFFATFYNSALTSIPEGLFDKNILAGQNAFFATFQSSNITSIPDDIFKYNIAVTTQAFASTFSGTAITSIPDDIFKYNISASTGAFQNTFKDCTELVHTLQSSMLQYNTSANSVQGMFDGCTNIEGSGLDFISACPASITGGTTTNCFSGCTNLSDYASIPAAWGGGGA